MQQTLVDLSGGVEEVNAVMLANILADTKISAETIKDENGVIAVVLVNLDVH